jgi:hypothetical protein
MFHQIYINDSCLWTSNKPVEGKRVNVTDYKLNIKKYIFYNKKNKPFFVKYVQIFGMDDKKFEQMALEREKRIEEFPAL